MPPRPKSQKRPVPDGLNQRAPISASVSKRLRGAMSVSSAASSFNSINSIVSGSTTEADTDNGNGPPSLVESFSSYPEDQAVEEYSSRGWVGLDDHPEEDDAALEIYEDDYDYVDDYEDEYEPGDENLAPPNSPPPIPAPRPAPRPLSERRPSPPPLQRPPPRERIPSQAPPERRHFQAPPNQGSRLGKRVAEAPVASARALVASRKRSSRPVEEAIASSSVPVKITQVFAHYTLWFVYTDRTSMAIVMQLIHPNRRRNGTPGRRRKPSRDLPLHLQVPRFVRQAPYDLSVSLIVHHRLRIHIVPLRLPNIVVPLSCMRHLGRSHLADRIASCQITSR